MTIPLKLRTLGAALWLGVPGLACAPTAATASGETPRLELPTWPLTADEAFQWIIPIKVHNPTDAGIYTDSLRLEIEDLGPGETHASRRRPYTLTTLAHILPSVSAGDSGTVKYQGPAHAEHARLHFRLFSHAADGRRYETDAVVDVRPGLISRQFPSRFLEDRKQRIEYVLVPEVWPPGPSPALLILHGRGSHARQLLPLAWDLANRGYTVMLVSLPGYGLSSGPPDLAGPATLKAVGRALDHLKRAPGVDSTRVAVWGIAEGATAATLLSAGRKDIEAVVAQSGIYDLATAARATASEELRRAIREEAGPEGAGWKRRSPIHSVRRIAAPLLILHGQRDTVVPAGQANDFAASLRAAGRDVTLRLFPDAGHLVPVAAARDTAYAFLKPRLRPVARGRP